MTVRSQLLSVLQQEDLNFLLTNRIPRRLAPQFIGWFSRIEQPLVRDASIGLWRLFSDLDLREAKKTHFRSMHDCFTRELKDGARPIDSRADILVSPCDAIVGACALVEAHRNGRYVTLRLTSSMYHRFHAPHDGRIEQVTYISGDTWNVNPIAPKPIERLFCKNERAVIQTRLVSGEPLTLVPVAAILVASIRLHFLDIVLNAQTTGSTVFPCDVTVRKGDELGYFEHGSTIIVLTPDHFEFCDNVREGARILAGQPLMRKPG